MYFPSYWPDGDYHFLLKWTGRAACLDIHGGKKSVYWAKP